NQNNVPPRPEFVSISARQSAPQLLSKPRKVLYRLPWLYPYKQGDGAEALEVVASVKASCPIQTRRGGSRPTWQSCQSFPRKLISFQSRRSQAPAARKDI